VALLERRHLRARLGPRRGLGVPGPQRRSSSFFASSSPPTSSSSVRSASRRDASSWRRPRISSASAAIAVSRDADVE